jgi:hypothetical protein
MLGITRAQALVNVLDLYARASAQEQADGRAWYFQASQVARALASKYHVAYPIACAVLAATSPQALWDWNHGNKQGNIYRAIEVLNAGSNPHAGRPHKSCMTNSVWNAARRIVLGHYTDPIYGLNGHKVSAFYLGLLTAGNADSVCVDTHMMNAIADTILPENTRQRIFGNEKRYTALAELVIEAALMVDEKPQQFQAIVWTVWRNLQVRTRTIVPLRAAA